VPLYPEVAAPDALSDVTKQKARSRGPGFLHESLVGRDRFELSTYGLRERQAKTRKQLDKGSTGAKPASIVLPMFS
jgi:hypothetical protein